MLLYYLRLLFSASAYAEYLTTHPAGVFGGADLVSTLGAVWEKLKTPARGLLGFLAMAAASPSSGWGALSEHAGLAPLALGAVGMISKGDKNIPVHEGIAAATEAQKGSIVESLLPQLLEALTAAQAHPAPPAQPPAAGGG